jgi:sensor histidine kinase regulating citrate/malate metabolism
MNKTLQSDEIPGLIFDSLWRMTVAVVTDSEDRIVAISDHYAKILNLQKKDIIGQPVTEILPNTRTPMIRKTGQPDRKLFTLPNGEIVLAHFNNVLQKLRDAKYSLNIIIGSSAFINTALA